MNYRFALIISPENALYVRVALVTSKQHINTTLKQPGVLSEKELRDVRAALGSLLTVVYDELVVFVEKHPNDSFADDDIIRLLDEHIEPSIMKALAELLEPDNTVGVSLTCSRLIPELYTYICVLHEVNSVLAE